MSRTVKKVCIRILVGHIGVAIIYLFIYLFSVLIRNQHLQKPAITKYQVGWGSKFGMIKCRTTDIPEFQNYEY